MIFVKDGLSLKVSGTRSRETLTKLGFRLVDGPTKPGFFKKKVWRFCKACSYKITPENAARHPYSGWHEHCLPQEIKEKLRYRRCTFCLKRIRPGDAVSPDGFHAECVEKMKVPRMCKACEKPIAPGTGGSYQFSNWHKVCKPKKKSYGSYI